MGVDENILVELQQVRLRSAYDQIWEQKIVNMKVTNMSVAQDLPGGAYAPSSGPPANSSQGIDCECIDVKDRDIAFNKMMDLLMI